MSLDRRSTRRRVRKAVCVFSPIDRGRHIDAVTDMVMRARRPARRKKAAA
jgi:hypothetical protein